MRGEEGRRTLILLLIPMTWIYNTDGPKGFLWGMTPQIVVSRAPTAAGSRHFLDDL
jgi:hypothetical protein